MAEKGIAVTRTGFRAQIRIRGVLHRKRFKKGTPLLTMKQWLLSRELKYKRPHAAVTGKFGDDARAYLETVTAMPTYAQRRQHIEEWIDLFDQQPRDSITPAQIRAQLHAWRAKGMAAASVNKRRSALMHLFAVLDGKSGPNPVKDTVKFQEPTPAPRALSYQDIARVFRKMPASKSKARLMVIAYTGLPHAQLATIQPADVDFTGRTVAVEGRKKGKGTPARIVPLTDDGVKAFRLMKRLQAWGPTPGRSAMRIVFRRACLAALKRDDIRPYDLRHSFGTELYRATGDIRATQILMGHSSERLTHRYTAGAEDARVLAAVNAFRANRGESARASAHARKSKRKSA